MVGDIGVRVYAGEGVLSKVGLSLFERPAFRLRNSGRDKRERCKRKDSEYLERPRPADLLN